MLDSVIHSAIMAGIFAKMPMLDTRLVIFDTNVVDNISSSAKLDAHQRFHRVVHIAAQIYNIRIKNNKPRVKHRDDDYLVGISNKGIVKRAYKDKEEAAAEIVSMEEEVSVQVGGMESQSAPRSK